MGNKTRTKFTRPRLLTSLCSEPQLHIIFVLSFIIGGCTPTGSPIYNLDVPKFVPQLPPDSTAEDGIGQDPNSQPEAIFLQWYSARGAASYKLWRTNVIGLNQLPTEFSSTSLPGSDTSYSDVVEVGTTYYYYLTSVGSGGAGESKSSDTVRYTLVERPTTQYPGTNNPMDTNNLEFGWQQDPTFGGHAVIRTEIASSKSLVWVSKQFWSQYNASGSIAFNYDGRASAKLVEGVNYRWRIDLFTDSSQGAKSMWQTFTVK